MAFLQNPHKMAGLLSLLASLLILGQWYIHLFVAIPSCISLFQMVGETIGYVFSPENPSRSYFLWLAVAPVALAAFSFSYWFGLSRSRDAAIILLVLSVVLGLSAFYFADWRLAVFVALPSYFGVFCVRNAT